MDGKTKLTISTYSDDIIEVDISGNRVTIDGGDAEFDLVLPNGDHIPVSVSYGGSWNVSLQLPSGSALFQRKPDL